MKLRLLALALVASCGWHQGLLAPEAAPHARTIGIKIFGNETMQPDVEADFAPHMSAAVLDYVQMDLAAPQSSDLVIRGTVIEFRRRNGIRSEDNELLEGSVRVEVTAELVTRLDQTVLATAQTGLWAEYATGTVALSSPGIGEDPALQRLYRNLADRLVLELFDSVH